MNKDATHLNPVKTLAFSFYMSHNISSVLLEEPVDIKVMIYDVQGRVVRALDLGHQTAGVYHNRSRAAHWDGRNDIGELVATGVYFYKLTAYDFTVTRKMFILK